MKSRGTFDRMWSRRQQAVAHALATGTLTLAIVLMPALHGTSGMVHADVPTAGDIAACNQEAREGVRDRAASPTSKDQAGADAARTAGAQTAEGRGAKTAVTQSSDPQIHGMDGEGAKDAAYRAAYRVCMRQKGF